MYPDQRGVGEIPNGKEFPNPKEARQIKKEVISYLEQEVGGKAANLSPKQLFTQQNRDRRAMGLHEISRKQFEKKIKGK